MKYIAITFDDGRSDNYLLAKRIMDEHQLRGTVYITTGFVDGTWEEKEILRSPTRPLRVEEIKQLHQDGWEIGLHGDKHMTQVDDMHTAIKKLQSWKIENAKWGISIPNSNAGEAEVEAICAGEYGKEIAYIRRGRKCDTSKFLNRILYAAYSLLKSKWAYNRFNAENLVYVDEINWKYIPSVVVKSTDTPELIVDFIRRAPDQTMIVLMLHSILMPQHVLCGKDPWSWESTKFENLCAALKECVDKGVLLVSPLAEQLKEIEKHASNKK